MSIDLTREKAILLEELKRTSDFWLKHGWDKENGGTYTSLEQDGTVYSTDKSVWMQGRTAWTFSYLAKTFGKKTEWIEFAKSCLDFLEKHCINHEADGRLYFTVTADGQPLRQRRYRFSESFYIIANAEYGALMDDQVALSRAIDKYNFIKSIHAGELADPVVMSDKTISSTRAMRGLSEPMIFMNVASVMYRTDTENAEIYKNDMRQAAQDIIDYHMKPELKATLESVTVDGESLLEVSEGRLVNPGHDIECAWFLLQVGKILGDADIKAAAREVYNMAVASGWDKEYGGIIYFQDVLGKPVYQLESDMKLWWPQSEMLIASIMLLEETKEKKYLMDFRMVLDYLAENFFDAENGGWYGYLHFDNSQAMDAVKGGTFKGGFHELRALTLAYETVVALTE